MVSRIATETKRMRGLSESCAELEESHPDPGRGVVSSVQPLAANRKFWSVATKL
jgi:hypothetical protein